MNEGAKYFYEKAIEGYQSHWEHYNHWMNMYAIFNGALFVGFYTLEKKSDFILRMAILLLGCIYSWFWFFSARGFYRWLISWINVVKKQEKILENSLQKETDNKVVDVDTKIYRAFILGKDSNFFEYQPFSTQKLTQWFSASVAVCWTFITIYALSEHFSCISFCKTSISNIAAIGVVVVVFLCFRFFCRETPLNKTHYIFLARGKDDFDPMETN